MKKQSKLQTPAVERDGTSQARRLLAALDPRYAPVDERTLDDFVAFAADFGRRLRYVDAGGGVAGDWSGFVPDELDAAQVAAFVRDPARFAPDIAPDLHRPHFVLYLAFLRLVADAQAALNELPGRHLDFYYQDVLGMRGKPAVADEVEVLFDLTPSAGAVLVPAGTELSAPPDSAGVDRVYVTERDLVVNRAQVGAVSAVHVERRVTGLREARIRHRGDPAETALELFSLVYGRPGPGDPVLYEYETLVYQRDLVELAWQVLLMRHHELRDLMRYKRRRDEGAKEEARIDERIAQIDERIATLGTPRFAGLSRVKTLEDLNRYRHNAEEAEYIVTNLEMSVEEFGDLMAARARIQGDWADINAILATVGLRQEPPFRFSSDDFDPTAFDHNLGQAIGDPIDRAFPPEYELASIDEYYARIEQLEDEFLLTADEYKLVVDLITAEAREAQWGRGDRLLARAHTDFVYAHRRAALAEIHKSEGAEAMVAAALGEELESTEHADLVAEVEAARADRAADWDAIYRKLELAQRNRENLPPPEPVRYEWVNMHPWVDATEAPTRAEGLGWGTFGAARPSDPAVPPPTDVGWALASPLLALAEGRRVIEITLAFAGARVGAEHGLRDAFILELTTAAGWARPGTITVGDRWEAFGELAGLASNHPLRELAAVTVTIDVGAQADPIEAMPPADSGIATPWPAVRGRMLQHWDDDPTRRDGGLQRWVTRYPLLRDLRLAGVHLAVDVTGLEALTLENDEAVLDAKKPFEPFGTSPAVGSRLLVGHPELARKRLDSLAFELEWMKLPDSFATHYRHYPIAKPSFPDPAFLARIDIIDRRAVLPLAGAAPLFAEEGGKLSPIQSVRLDVGAAERPFGYDYERSLEADIDGEVADWERYIRWELEPRDFQHDEYGAVASRQAIRLAADLSKAGEKGLSPEQTAAYEVKAPYTPKLKSMRASYTASRTLDMATSPAEGEETLFHLHPFGFALAETERVAGEVGLPLVAPYEAAGELYVGLDGVEAPQVVSFLFQMAPGSANPDTEPEPVEWSYASGGTWQPFGSGVLFDGTRDLINAGIVELDLPVAAPSTRLPPERYWLRARVLRTTESTADARAIHTQAASAVFVDNDNAPDHYALPLPAGSITQPVSAIPGISGVLQPYSSHGGRPAEDPRMFAARVSERLRHKQRALTMWDYEHLVLERFPEIYKVRCLSADVAPDGAEPGVVTIVVIPDVRRKLPLESFEPKAPPEMLAEIHEYLAARAPAPVAIDVRNAHFIAVKTRMSVRFRGSGNEQFYVAKLIADLDRFLSPWAFDGAADIVMGGKVYANSIIDFVDTRPYVDFVANLQLFRRDAGDRFELIPPSDTGYHVSAHRPDGVLRAATEHVIDVIPQTGYADDLRTGIDFMQVELDFVVAG